MDTMKRSLLLVLVLAAAGSVACGLFGDSWQPPQVVKIESTEPVGSLFTSWGSWQSEAEEGAPQGLLLRDGDYILPQNGDVFIPYRASDGQSLTIAAENWIARIGETTVAILLDENGLAWVASASDRQLADLRWLAVPDEPAALQALKRIAAANPGVDLSCESEAAWLQALALFKPRTVSLGESPTTATLDAVAKQRQVETLIMEATEPGSLAVLTKLPNLRRLFLSDWNPAKTGPLPAGLSNLKTLVVFDSESLEDLAPLRDAPAGLEALSIINLKGVSDLTVLDTLTNLQMLIVKSDDASSDLSGLTSLRRLRWVGLPSKTTQTQFAAFVGAQPDITILDMMSNETVTDLSPLTSLNGLNGLILDGPLGNLDAVQKLTSLRFVGVSKDIYDKFPDQVAAVRKALPDALVVRVSPLCLGSGWILLLVPIPFVARLIRQRSRQLGRAA